MQIHIHTHTDRRTRTRTHFKRKEGTIIFNDALNMASHIW